MIESYLSFVAGNIAPAFSLSITVWVYFGSLQLVNQYRTRKPLMDIESEIKYIGVCRIVYTMQLPLSIIAATQYMFIVMGFNNLYVSVVMAVAFKIYLTIYKIKYTNFLSITGIFKDEGRRYEFNF